MIPYSSYAFAAQLIPSLLISVAVLFGYLRQTSKTALAVWVDVVLVSAFIALLAARIEHIVLEWTYFNTYPEDILIIWYGGFGWHAMLVIGAPVLWFCARWRKVDFGVLGDGFALVVPLLGSALWWGCRSAGCGYGIDAPDEMSPWLTGFLPDQFGGAENRIELQLLGAILFALLFALIAWLTTMNRLENRRLWVVLCLIGFVMFMVGFLRGDDATNFLFLRSDQWLDLTVLLAGLCGYWASRPKVSYNKEHYPRQ